MDGSEVVLVGGGGHAIALLETLRSVGYRVVGYFARDIASSPPVFEAPWLGLDDNIVGYVPERYEQVLVAIGDNATRQKRSQDVADAGGTLVDAVSPAATVSDSATVGPGTLVMPGAVINAFAHIGTGVIVNTGAIVEHECHVSDFAHIAPGAVLAGNVHVGEGALVGVGARVIPGRRIGAWATVGAGAVVIEDVPDGATVVGVPARVVKQAEPRD